MDQFSDTARTDTIGLIAAMPQEVAPLLKRVAAYRRERAAGFNLYRFELTGVPVVLIESGMGPRHAARAAEVLIAQALPCVLLNYGLAGAVLPGLRVADLVLAEQVFFLEDGQMTKLPGPNADLAQRVWDALSAATPTVARGAFITAGVITNKATLGAALGPEIVNPVLEMETAAVLRVAARAGIPLVALRGVSDAAEEELGFSLEEFCDSELRIRPLRVLRAIARKPWIIPQLIRLSGNTNRAGNVLAQGVEVALKALGSQVSP